LLCFSTITYSQITVNTMVVTAKPDTLKRKMVYVYPDTSVPTPLFPLKSDTTMTSTGFASIVIPTLPLNTDFYVSTLQCDSQTFKIDTLTYVGNNSMSTVLEICITSTDSFSGVVYLGKHTNRPLPKQAMVYLIQKCDGKDR